MAKAATTIGELTEPLRTLVKGFLERHPEAVGPDVYRLIYDGTMGLVDHPAEAELAHLETLAAAAGSAPAKELTEPVSLGNEIVRVHLAPYLAGGGDLPALAAAATRTRDEHKPRKDLLFTLWAGFVHMNRRHEFRLDRDALEHFEMRVAAASYPRADPSPAFVQAYAPCYTLVRPDLVPQIPG